MKSLQARAKIAIYSLMEKMFSAFNLFCPLHRIQYISLLVYHVQTKFDFVCCYY